MTSTAELNRDYDLTGVPAIVAGSVKLGLLEGIAVLLFSLASRLLDGVVETGAPGVVALVRSGPRTWQGASGLGDLRANRPARAGERFRIGSVSKSFVATVALQLVGEGTLGLDDHLERWLPGDELVGHDP